MAQSYLRTGPNLLLKVSYEKSDITEKIIGYAQNLSFSQALGQKPIFTVDSPFIQELAQAAAPTSIRGTVTLFMPKGSDPVRAGLVTPATDIAGSFGNGEKDDLPLHSVSRSLNWRFYDRYTQELAFAINKVKVSQWSATITAKQVVRVSLQFEGTFFESGVS